MFMGEQSMAKHMTSAEAELIAIGRLRLEHVVLIMKRFVITAWRTGGQGARG